MRRHAFDPASFVLGLVIAAVAVVYLVAETTDRQVDGAWVLPAALVGLGIAAIAAGLTRALRRDDSPGDTGTDDGPGVAGTSAEPVSGYPAGSAEASVPHASPTEPGD